MNLFQCSSGNNNLPPEWKCGNPQFCYIYFLFYQKPLSCPSSDTVIFGSIIKYNLLNSQSKDDLFCLILAIFLSFCSFFLSGTPNSFFDHFLSVWRQFLRVGLLKQIILVFLHLRRLIIALLLLRDISSGWKIPS